MNELLKLINIWWSYKQHFSGPRFNGLFVSHGKNKHRK